MSILRKLFAGISVLAMIAMVTPTSAITVEELTAQIAALTAQIAALQGTTTTTTGTSAITGVPAGFTFQTNLKLGSNNSDVVYLKKVLDVEVPTHSAWTGTPYFGTGTKAAVITFQEKYAIEVLAPFGLTAGTGFVGASTRAKLNALLASGSTGTGTGTGTGTTVPTGTGLTVALASDTPAAGTFIRDTGELVAQANANFTKFVFTNGDSSEATVTTLKLKRGGISADTDIANVYLYDGTTLLAEYSAFSSQIVTFTNAAGLFTIPAGGSRTITVKGDLSAVNATVASINFGINASTDVISNATAVNGVFPLTGNNMAVATVADQGYVNITSFTTFPATIDPGLTNQELWRFSVTASDQDMQIEKLMMTVVGTISSTDVQNLKLEVGGVGISDTIQLASDKTLTFDFSASPYKITKGQTKIIVVKGDVPTGTGRTFKFTIRQVSDFIVKDTMYGVYVKPLKSGAAFAVVDAHAAGNGTSINNGTLTITTASDSPSGNVANSMTGGVNLAKWNFKANGEAIKLTAFRVVLTSGAGEALDNGQLYYNGSQVGSTVDDITSGENNNFTISVIIPAGETGVFEFKANTTKSNGTALTDGSTILVQAKSAGLTATGQSSLATITGADANGRTLTVASGTMSVAKNNSMSDYTTSLPTGVVGAAGIKVGSFVMTAGAGEGVTITQIVVSDDADVATSDFGDNFQNLKLMHGTTQLGTTQGTLGGVEGENYTFSVSPAITLAAGEQYVVDIYADILSGAAEYAAAEVGLEVDAISATGVLTSSDASLASQNKDLQKLVIASYGTLTVASVASPTTPVAGQLVMGSSDNTFFVASYAAGAAEAMQITQIIVTDTSDYAGSLSGIKLYSVGTGSATPVQLGSTINTFSAESNGTATFTLSTPWIIPANTTYYLVVKAGVNAYPDSVSGGTHTLNIAATTGNTVYGVSSGVAIAESGSATAAAQDVYRTKLTAAKNASSPSGSAVAGAGATVLEVDVAANSNYTGALSVMAVTMSGSASMSGSGDANLYDSAAPSTALKTEAYKAPTCSAGTTALTVSDTTGIPVGANVMVSINGTAVTRKVLSITDGTTLTVDSAVTACDGTTDYVYYRPMQPGTGKLFFGAQTVLGANLANAATSVAVSDIDGFAYGDTITVIGYDTNGVLRTGTATITALTTGPDTIGFSGGITLGATIDYDYLSTASNAITYKHNSLAVVYEGVGTNGSINKQVTAGTTVRFIVKGDTTGATTNNTLRADIAAAADFVWTDSLSWTITTDTVTFPVTGGTLTY